jgi:hypothetical protein
MPLYHPALPWVPKIRLTDGTIVAADLFVYVDGARITGATKDDCWSATRQAGSIFNSLGIHEAARKRRWPSKQPRASAGSIVETTEQGVFVQVSNEKWDKCRRYIGEIVAELASSADETLEFKALERKRGFLIYVTRTYPVMVPYLKGFHQTLDSWRANCGEDGWKLSPTEITAAIRKNIREPETLSQENPPERVKIAPRFRTTWQRFRPCSQLCVCQSDRSKAT